MRESISRTDDRCAASAGAVRGGGARLLQRRGRRAEHHAVGGQPARRGAGARGRTALIERGTRPVELTEGGHALVRHATGIFARLDGAEQELGEIAHRRRARLRFGSFPTALATFVPPAFARFRRKQPDVLLTVVDDHLQRLLPRLEAGELDLALIYESDALPEVAARDLVRTPLLEDVYRVVLPPRHRLAKRRALELADLADEPWIGGSPTSAWFRIVRDACGFTPAVEYATDDYSAVQALVAAGLGVSVIPGLAVAHALPGVEVRTPAVRRARAPDLRRPPARRLPRTGGDRHAREPRMELGVHLPLIALDHEPRDLRAYTRDARGARLSVPVRERPPVLLAAVAGRADGAGRGARGVGRHDAGHDRRAAGDPRRGADGGS